MNTSVKIKLHKVAIILLYNVLLFGSISGFSSSSNISMIRSFSDSICIPGEEVIITISLEFEDIEFSARGIYIVDNIPKELANSVKTLSVKLDITDITNKIIVEKDTLNSVYKGTTIFRWILETPPWFSENLPVHPYEEVIIMYSITIPQDIEERTYYNFPNSSWITVLNPFNNPSYEFGFEDFPNPEIVVDLPNRVTLHDEDSQIVFSLSQNYPNPFNPSTIISFDLYEGAFVKLVVFNNKGEIVTKLLDSKLLTGHYDIPFNIKSLLHKKKNFSSGIYYYQLHVNSKKGEFNQTKKMVILK